MTAMHPPADHADHELIAVTGRRRSGEITGWLACFDCSAIVRPLRVCGRPTRLGRPCRVPIREDLGYDRCWSHGEGAGATSTPRARRRAS